MPDVKLDEPLTRKITRYGHGREVLYVAVLAGALLLFWSGLFLSTYKYPFYWDDYHQVRPYSWNELVSTLHGYSDPDQLETPAYRPPVAFLFAIQGWIFGENIVLQRIFMTLLMEILLFVLGLFLLELRFALSQIGIVFALFVFSRVFASLNMWLTLGTLILCYIFMILTGYLFLLWIKHARIHHGLLMFACAIGAVFTREEGYVLPLALALVWSMSRRPGKSLRRVLIAVLGVLTIAGVHFALRSIFVPETLSDPELGFNTLKLKMLLISMESSWLPGGLTTIGFTDTLLADLWIAFLIGLVVMVAWLGRSRSRWLLVGTCLLGCVLSLPALGAPRSFGIAMPTLAFLTAIAISVAEVWRQLASKKYPHTWLRYAFVCYIILGLAVGVAAGIRRSTYVAEALHPNCVSRVIDDAPLIFNLRERYVPVPEERREAARTRFEALGIYNVPDLDRMYIDSKKNPERYERNSQTRTALFLPKYDYLSY
jgi:hypothetical protein